LSVTCNTRHVLNLSLRDQEAVEWIAVMTGQAEIRKNVRRFNRHYPGDPELSDVGLKEIGALGQNEFSCAYFQNNLPKTRDAEPQLCRGIFHHLQSPSGKLRLLSSDAPQKDAGVEKGRHLGFSEKLLHLALGHRRIPSLLEYDLVFGAPEYTLHGAVDRHQFDDRLAGFSNDDLISHACALYQLGELRFRLVDIDFHEFVIVSYPKG
jgi:hypothetical protein